jgi:hypothetical protein
MDAALNARRDAIFEAMLAATEDPSLPGSDAERRQFVAGFLDLAVHAAAGDTAPRDEYLSLVVPAVKQSGMSLAVIMAGMVGVAMGGANALSGAELTWWYRFCNDYTHRLLEAWNK